MNKIIAFFLFFIGISTTLFSQELSRKIESKKINSSIFKADRELVVYLPYEYFDELDRKFEVVYILDAQSEEYFDMTSSIIGYLSSSQQINPMIIIGIKTADRYNEFLPKNKFKKTQERYESPMGNADLLIDHLEKEVFPFIDKNYRTLSTKIAIGHSLGGTFLNYTYLNYPNLFDATISISPNLAYDQEQLIKQIKNFKNKENPVSAYNYIAFGGKGRTEKRFYPATTKAVELFGGFKTEGLLFDYAEMPLENHSSIVSIATQKGMLNYHKTIFLNARNTISYYQQLEKNKEIILSAEKINMLAYQCFWQEKTTDAIKIIAWAIEKFPKAYNCYDSMGEFQEKLGNLADAKGFYQKAIKIIENQKNTIDKKLYKESLEVYQKNYKRVSK